MLVFFLWWTLLRCKCGYPSNISLINLQTVLYQLLWSCQRSKENKLNTSKWSELIQAHASFARMRKLQSNERRMKATIKDRRPTEAKEDKEVWTRWESITLYCIHNINYNREDDWGPNRVKKNDLLYGRHFDVQRQHQSVKWKKTSGENAGPKISVGAPPPHTSMVLTIVLNLQTVLSSFEDY